MQEAHQSCYLNASHHWVPGRRSWYEHHISSRIFNQGLIHRSPVHVQEVPGLDYFARAPLTTWLRLHVMTHYPVLEQLTQVPCHKLLQWRYLCKSQLYFYAAVLNVWSSCFFTTVGARMAAEVAVPSFFFQNCKCSLVNEIKKDCTVPHSVVARNISQGGGDPVSKKKKSFLR